MDGRRTVGSDILGLEVGRSVIRGVLLDAAVTNVLDFAEVRLGPNSVASVESGSADCGTIGPVLHHLLEQLQDRGGSILAAGLAYGPRWSGVGSGPELGQWLQEQAESLGQQFVHAGEEGISFAPLGTVEGAKDVCRLVGLGLVRIDLAPVAAARVLTDPDLEVTTLGSGIGWRARLRNLEVVEAIERLQVTDDAPFVVRNAMGLLEPVRSFRRIAVPPELLVRGFDAAQLAVAVGAAVGVANRSPGDLLHGQLVGPAPAPPEPEPESWSVAQVPPKQASAPVGPTTSASRRQPRPPRLPVPGSGYPSSTRFDIERGNDERGNSERGNADRGNDDRGNDGGGSDGRRNAGRGNDRSNGRGTERTGGRAEPVEQQVGRWSVLSTDSDPVQLFGPDPEQVEELARPEGKTRTIVTAVVAAVAVLLPLYILVTLDNDDDVQTVDEAIAEANTTVTGEAPAGEEESPGLLSTDSDPQGPVTLDGEDADFDDWPGGRGTVPVGPPLPREALFNENGLLLLTGSVPSWAVAVDLVESTGGKLPGGVGSVDNQLTWHPDAPEDLRSGRARFDPPLLYPSGATAVPEEAKAGLDLVADILAENPSVFIVILAHTDDLGDTEENNAVAFARATGVVDYLRSVGAADTQMVITADDDPVPAVPNEGDEGQTFNRRVEIYFENLLSPGAVLDP